MTTFLRMQPPTSAAEHLIEVPRPYLLFLGSVTDPGWAKTAFGLRDWVPEACVGELSLPGCRVTTGLPEMTIRQALDAGARSLVIGVAPIGGKVDPTWIGTLSQALEAGLELVSGMHTPLASVPALRAIADHHGRKLIDVRRPPIDIPIATGKKRSGQRLLTVGTDCALGKKYTALTLTRAFRAQGVDTDFRATGQTGILIAGRGIPIDAVVADFIAGAAESLSPDAPDSHWDVVEGQGSLAHPAYAGVSLGLLHGSQPDVLVICHDPRRAQVLGYPDYSTPAVRESIELNLQLARRVNRRVRCAGVSLNTGGLSEEQAEHAMAGIEKECGLPVADPIRGGRRLDVMVASCLNS